MAKGCRTSWITIFVVCIPLLAACSFLLENGMQSYRTLSNVLLTLVAPTLGAGHQAIRLRQRYSVHSRLQTAAAKLESAEFCVGMSQEQCVAALRSAGYGDSPAKPEDGNLGLALLGAILLVVAFVFYQAMIPEKKAKEQSIVERRETMQELYMKWGFNFAKARIDQNVPKPVSSKPDSEQQQDVGASRRLLRAESRAAGCRDFWSVDRQGRDLNEFNDTYSLLNHINMAKDAPRVEAYRSALQRTAAGRRVLDVGAGAFCLLSRLALRAGASSVDCVEQSEASVEHAICIFKSEEKGIECEGLQGIGASVLEKFSDLSCNDGRDSPQKSRQLQLSLRASGQSSERGLQLFQGLSSDVDVPLGGGYNLVVHEILGHIAGAEGVGAAISDLCHRGLLAPDCVFVPRRAVTMFAPTKEIEPSLEEQLLSRKFGGEMVDLRCETKYHARRFSEDSFLAAPAIFEDLNFGAGMPLEQTGNVDFDTTSDGVFDGLHFHMVVDMDGERKINTMLEETSWETTYVRLFKPGIFLPAGSRISVKTHVRLNTTSPEYAVEVIVDKQTASFSWSGST